MSYSLSVVAYLGNREDASMPKVLWGSLGRMLEESLGMLHVDFMSLIRRLSNFLMFRIEKGVAYSMPKQMTVLRIFIFCCSDKGGSSKVVF